MYDNEAERLTRLKDFARNHVTRASILALVAQDEGRPLDPDVLGPELPNSPPAGLVRYHLSVLRTASLLPPEAAGDTGSPAS